MTISGAATHNLQRVTARFPVGKMTVVCGVSGSGKTSLVRHTLYPLLCGALGQDLEADAEPKADGVGPLPLIRQHAQVVMVSQAALGRSSRSNIATYLGIFTTVREALAGTVQAKTKKLTPGHFSFNVAGGRCETCKGLGTVVEDLSFLGEVAITCPSCEGRRFADAVLDVTYRGKNLIEILTLTVAEARELFFDMHAMVTVLDQVINLGLGYLTLGQSTASFSGGEAQRVKLLSLMKDARGVKPAILIFDEPTTGLSDRDVRWLLAQLRGLTDQGNTLIVVEHHLGMIAAADWAVEIGPEAAAGGGELVYEGEPRGMIAVQRSRTAPFLNDAVGS